MPFHFHLKFLNSAELNQAAHLPTLLAFYLYIFRHFVNTFTSDIVVP